jgi:SAM-dependent methyltransferase
MRSIKSVGLSIVNRCLLPLGYKIVPAGYGLGTYIDMAATVAGAKAKGQTVCEYVETLWNQKGSTARVIEEMKRSGCFTTLNNVLELGPGTGRYLDFVLREAKPRRYEIYETARDWAGWLAETYSPTVIRQHADGHTLHQTPSQSCELVHGHGVFVYLSLLHSFEYFSEVCRVLAPGGYLVFDFLPAAKFDEPTINRWLKTENRYPVVLPDEHVRKYFAGKGFKLIHEFDNRYGEGHSHYFVFRRGLDK